MRYQTFVRSAALVLAAAAATTGAVQAQTTPRAVPPQHTVTDAAPRPAEERSSVGAIVMMDQPVLAQREQMQQAQAREPDTRAMGAAARALQKALTREELESQRAKDEAELRR